MRYGILALVLWLLAIAAAPIMVVGVENNPGLCKLAEIHGFALDTCN